MAAPEIEEFVGNLIDDDATWLGRITAERPVLGRLPALMTAKSVMSPEVQSTKE